MTTSLRWRVIQYGSTMDEPSGSFDSGALGGPSGVRDVVSSISEALKSLGLSLVAVAFVEAAFVQVVSPLESVVLVASCLWSSALASKALAVSAELMPAGLMLRF